jgi:cell division protease FtsH
LTYTEDDGEIFLGRSVTRHKQVSDVTAHAIDEEVRGLVDSCYAEAKRVLMEHEDKLHVMAAALMKFETIDETQIKDIMSGREPRPPEGWDEPGEGEVGKVEAPDNKGAAPLGGPAGQH